MSAEPLRNDWYYELDGRTHGPLGEAELHELLGRSGETALDVRHPRGSGRRVDPFRPLHFRGESVTAAEGPFETRSSAGIPGSTSDRLITAGGAVIGSGRLSSVALRPHGSPRRDWGLAADQRVRAVLAKSPYARERRYFETCGR